MRLWIVSLGNLLSLGNLRNLVLDNVCSDTTVHNVLQQISVFWNIAVCRLALVRENKILPPGFTMFDAKISDGEKLTAIVRLASCFVMIGTGGGTLQLWDVFSKRCVQTFIGHRLREFADSGASNIGPSGINHIVFSANGQTVLSSSDDMTTRLWNTDTGSCIQTFGGVGTEGHSGIVLRASFVPSCVCENCILTASADGSIMLWKMDNGQAPIRIAWPHVIGVSGDYAGVTFAAFSGDGSFLVTSSNDGKAKIWSVHSGTCIRTLRYGSNCFPHSYGKFVRSRNSLSLSSSGRRLVTACADGTTKVWDLASGSRVQKFGSPFHCLEFEFCNCGAIAENEDMVLGILPDRRNQETCNVELWSITMGRCIQRYDHGGDDEAELTVHDVVQVAFSADSQYVLTTVNCSVKIWSVETGECVQTLHIGGFTVVTAAAFLT